jgi:hypothetical protein
MDWNSAICYKNILVSGLLFIYKQPSITVTYIWTQNTQEALGQIQFNNESGNIKGDRRTSPSSQMTFMFQDF